MCLGMQCSTEPNFIHTPVLFSQHSILRQSRDRVPAAAQGRTRRWGLWTTRQASLCGGQVVTRASSGAPRSPSPVPSRSSRWAVACSAAQPGPHATAGHLPFPRSDPQSDRLLCDARRPRHPLIPSCNTVRLQNERIQTRARQPVLHSHSYHGIYLLSDPHAHRSRAVRVRNGIRRSSESAPCAAARHPCDLARTPSAPRSGPSSPAAAAAARRIICSWRRGA